MGISKVILNGVTKVDLTQDTVDETNLLAGETATGADGEPVEGTIATKSSTNFTVSGATVTAPAGYYSAAASKSVATTTHPNPTASINSTTGVVTASHTQTTGYVTGGTTTGTLDLTTQAGKTVTPTESEQTAVAAGRYTTGAVKVGAISSTYVGSGITQRDSDDLTASGATVTAPAGYYAEAASKSVASGTAGTPTATKGTVSNHSISVTPSVTNTTGYITGGTKSGTAVTVSASELVSGTLAINSSGTKDVTNYASASVTAGTAGTPTATKGTVSNHSVMVTPSVTNTTGYITGGTKTGTAVTVSVSELESGTKTITENGTGISVSGYSMVDIDVSGSSVTVNPLNVTQNGTYTAPTGTAYSPVTVAVESGGGSSAEEKDVNFIDYDGTILYSYTYEEFTVLTELPPNPSHAGLIAQGWNSTLDGIRYQYNSWVRQSGARVYVGQMYETASGDTELDIELDNEDLLSPYLAVVVNGTAVVTWGDGSTTDTLTGSSSTAIQFVQHTYPSSGNYTISIHVASGNISFYSNSSSYGGILRATTNTNNEARNRIYNNTITHIRLGRNYTMSGQGFMMLANLQTITIPNDNSSVTYSHTYVFNECLSLSSVTFPIGQRYLGNYYFYNCTSLKYVSVPM